LAPVASLVSVHH